MVYEHIETWCTVHTALNIKDGILVSYKNTTQLLEWRQNSVVGHMELPQYAWYHSTNSNLVYWLQILQRHSCTNLTCLDVNICPIKSYKGYRDAICGVSRQPAAMFCEMRCGENVSTTSESMWDCIWNFSAES